MAKVTMTLTEALAKKAVIYKRLENWSDLSSSNCVRQENKQMIFVKKACDKKIGSLTLEEATAQAQSVFDKMNSDFNNYVALTQAINEANVINKVTIAGKEMTIAAAIIYKNAVVQRAQNTIISIINRQIQIADKALADYIKQYTNPELLNNFLTVTLGPEESRNPEDVEKQIELYNKTNNAEIIDPLKLREKVQEMQKAKEDFITTVDTALSIANATIKIEVEYVD